MGTGASAKKANAGKELERSESGSGIPGVQATGARGTLNRKDLEQLGNFLYWADLEKLEIDEWDKEAAKVEVAIRAVVDANNSVLHAFWRLHDALCDQYDICTVRLVEDGNDFKLVVMKKGRELADFEIEDMLKKDIVSCSDKKNPNLFKTHYEKLQADIAKVCKFKADLADSKLTIKDGHSIEIRKDDAIVLANETRDVNTCTFKLANQLLKESVEENVASVGCLLLPALDKLNDMRCSGSFKEFKAMMSFVHKDERERRGQVYIDGCCNLLIHPSPVELSGFDEHRSVYEAAFGKGGLCEAVNRAIALIRVSNPRLLRVPQDVIKAQKKNWMQLANDTGKFSKEDTKKIPQQVSRNLNKLKTTNVLIPAAVEYVATVFFEIYNAMRESGLLPVGLEVAESAWELEVPELEAVLNGVAYAYDEKRDVSATQHSVELNLVNSAAAQSLAEKRGSGRPAGEGPPPTRKLAVADEVKEADKEQGAEDKDGECEEEPTKEEEAAPAAAEEPVSASIQSAVEATAKEGEEDDEDGA